MPLPAPFNRNLGNYEPKTFAHPDEKKNAAVLSIKEALISPPLLYGEEKGSLHPFMMLVI